MLEIHRPGMMQSLVVVPGILKVELDLPVVLEIPLAL
jgi:hypothetical protein